MNALLSSAFNPDIAVNSIKNGGQETNKPTMSLKVLIVDDDEVVLFIHELIIKKSGLSEIPINFKNGQVAMDFLNDHHIKEKQFLIFLDINMPVMNGWCFLDTIQHCSYREKINVIIVTSSIDQIDRRKAKEYPQVIDYIEKPFSMEACLRIKQLPEIEHLLK